MVELPLIFQDLHVYNYSMTNEPWLYQLFSNRGLKEGEFV